jgi:hypothetical protein
VFPIETQEISSTLKMTTVSMNAASTRIVSEISSMEKVERGGNYAYFYLFTHNISLTQLH